MQRDAARGFKCTQNTFTANAGRLPRHQFTGRLFASSSAFLLLIACATGPRGSSVRDTRSADHAAFVTASGDSVSISDLDTFVKTEMNALGMPGLSVAMIA